MKKLLLSALFVFGVSAIVITVIKVELGCAEREAVALERRVKFCKQICSQDGAKWSGVRNQKIGFGSFEWRCYCDNGTYKLIF
jgi:hypothetical protein